MAYTIVTAVVQENFEGTYDIREIESHEAPFNELDEHQNLLEVNAIGNKNNRYGLFVGHAHVIGRNEAEAYETMRKWCEGEL